MAKKEKSVTNQEILEAVNKSFGELEKKVDNGFKEMEQKLENVDLRLSNFAYRFELQDLELRV